MDKDNGSMNIVDIINELDKSSLEDIEDEIIHLEYRIRALKTEWDREYSRLVRVALAQSTGGSS